MRRLAISILVVGRIYFFRGQGCRGSKATGTDKSLGLETGEPVQISFLPRGVQHEQLANKGTRERPVFEKRTAAA